MKTLKLFNAVIYKSSSESPLFLHDLGILIEPSAMWAKDQIISFYTKNNLDSYQLNQTFHKSWRKIKDSHLVDLYIQQMIHYASTYGTNFKGEVYIPSEKLDLPEGLKIPIRIIKGIPKFELIEKCLNLLQSGIALKEETVDDIIIILSDQLNYEFTGNEGIKNKEAIVKIADLFNIFPKSPAEFLRYIVYKSTGNTLLIKNDLLISDIKQSRYNPSMQFKKYGLKELSSIFNRFKHLFLAYKEVCPSTINRISKLSKKHHEPMKDNPLNLVTSRLLTEKDTHYLEKATIFSLFKALSACYSRQNGQNCFVYRVRNGKSWTKRQKMNVNTPSKNFKFILSFIKERYDLKHNKIYLPENIDFALPLSEKMFVGNVPEGTKFFADKMAVGVYWKNSDGASDLDLSALTFDGDKVGWNASYSFSNGEIMYSGDVTNAPDGAVEYMYANTGLECPILIKNNIYSGKEDSKYKIIIGKGDNIDRNYMMNPDNLFCEMDCQAVQKQSIVGLMIPHTEGQCFIVLNCGAGNVRVSGNTDLSRISTNALMQKYCNSYNFNMLIEEMGASIVSTKEESDISFDLPDLQKDSFTEFFIKN